MVDLKFPMAASQKIWQIFKAFLIKIKEICVRYEGNIMLGNTIGIFSILLKVKNRTQIKTAMPETEHSDQSLINCFKGDMKKKKSRALFGEKIPKQFLGRMKLLEHLYFQVHLTINNKKQSIKSVYEQIFKKYMKIQKHKYYLV